MGIGDRNVSCENRRKKHNYRQQFMSCLPYELHIHLLYLKDSQNHSAFSLEKDKPIRKECDIKLCIE